MSVRVIRQKITAGSDFDGTLPSTTPVTTVKGISKSYPTDTQGGRFDFELTAPGIIDSIELTLGGQSSYQISKLDSDGLEHILWLSSDPDTDYQSLIDERFRILANEIILVKTTGASANMVATISVSPHADGR